MFSLLYYIFLEVDVDLSFKLSSLMQGTGSFTMLCQGVGSVLVKGLRVSWTLGFLSQNCLCPFLVAMTSKLWQEILNLYLGSCRLKIWGLAGSELAELSWCCMCCTTGLYIGSVAISPFRGTYQSFSKYMESTRYPKTFHLKGYLGPTVRLKFQGSDRILCLLCGIDQAEQNSKSTLIQGYSHSRQIHNKFKFLDY